MSLTIGRKLALATRAGAGLLLGGAVLTGLPGCGLLDGSSRLESALEHLPADVRDVTFVDRAAIAERWDLDLATPASDSELAAWAEDAAEEGYGTQLGTYTRPMQQAAFSDLDVAWEVAALGDDGPYRVWKLDDDIDFDDLVDDLLDAGFTRADAADAADAEGAEDDDVVLTADPADAADQLVGGRYPISLMATTALVPDEHLVVTGEVEEVLSAVHDAADSLSDARAYDDLLERAEDLDDLEYAYLALPDDDACAGQPGQQAPEAIGLFVPTDADSQVVRLLADDDAATADADGLRTALGDHPVLGELDPSVEADGDAAVVRTGFGDRRLLVQALTALDVPFSCGRG